MRQNMFFSVKLSNSLTLTNMFCQTIALRVIISFHYKHYDVTGQREVEQNLKGEAVLFFVYINFCQLYVYV